mgnify:CR=1 FL=1
MRLLSDAAEYALRAAVWLAERRSQPHTTQQIAAGTRASPGYLAKVLQMLARAEIVRGQRGVGGGWILDRDPGALTVLDVINAVDPVERITRCPLGLAEHGTELCALHRRVDDAIAHLEHAFASTTIAEILADTKRHKPLCSLRISAPSAPSPRSP